jgi:hypothetical protein
MKTKTKIKIIVSGVILAGVLFAGHKIYKIVTAPEVIITKSVDKETGEETFKITEPNETDIEKELPYSMSEKSVQQVIHDMSHQKVGAKDKWGAMPLTPERVNRLIEVIKENNYYSSNVYLEILNRWAKGDFSQAVEDHNIIWDLQGGNVGEAQRLLSPVEEKLYIKENFDTEVK